MEDAATTLPAVVYRLCKRVSPAFPDDYVAIGTRRSFDSQPESVRLAAQGLSVYSIVDAMVATSRRYPRLGTIVVRYAIAANSSLQLRQLVEPPEHITILGDFSELHACLDTSWRFDIVTIER